MLVGLSAVTASRGIYFVRKSVGWASLAAVVCVALAGFATASVSAVSGTQSGGITVTPAKVQLTLPKGQTKATVPVNFRNNSGQLVYFSAQLQAVQLSAKGALVPAGELSGDLAKSLTIDRREFAVEPGQLATVNVLITDSPNLAPGGQYAALYVQQIADSGASLAITPAVSVSLFVVKEDGARRELAAQSLKVSGGLLARPQITTVNFIAAGNVAVVPRGVAEVTDPRGRTVLRAIVNQESLTVQPKSSLKLQSALSTTNRLWVPGRYTAVLHYRYDGGDTFKQVQATVWYFPPLGIGILCGCLLLCCFVGWVIYRLLSRRRVRQTGLAEAVKKHRSK